MLPRRQSRHGVRWGQPRLPSCRDVTHRDMHSFLGKVVDLLVIDMSQFAMLSESSLQLPGVAKLNRGRVGMSQQLERRRDCCRKYWRQAMIQRLADTLSALRGVRSARLEIEVLSR